MGAVWREGAGEAAALLPRFRLAWGCRIDAAAHGEPDVLIDARIGGPQVGVRADHRLQIDEWRHGEAEVAGIHVNPGRAIVVGEAVLAVADGHRRVGRTRDGCVRHGREWTGARTIDG